MKIPTFTTPDVTWIQPPRSLDEAMLCRLQSAD
jgi:hypothetical protein